LVGILKMRLVVSFPPRVGAGPNALRLFLAAPAWRYGTVVDEAEQDARWRRARGVDDWLGLTAPDPCRRLATALQVRRAVQIAAAGPPPPRPSLHDCFATTAAAAAADAAVGTGRGCMLRLPLQSLLICNLPRPPSLGDSGLFELAGLVILSWLRIAWLHL
jgi:hypothetical protein